MFSVQLMLTLATVFMQFEVRMDYNKNGVFLGAIYKDIPAKS